MGRMCPPQSVKMCPTPACLTVRATRCPPLTSAMLGGRRRDVHDLELQAVRILEEHCAVARSVVGELAGRPVERGELARNHEVSVEAVHIFSVVDAQRYVIEAGALAVEAVAGVGRIGGDDPEIG